MDDEDRPLLSGGTFAAGAPRRSLAHADAAHLLAGENLDPYSLDELEARLALLHAEIERIAAHKAQAAAHRLAAEALFKPRAG